MVVVGIRRRSQSFLGGAATCASSSRSLAAGKNPFHSRSTSLPTRSNPAVLASFDDHILSLRSLPPRLSDQPDQDGATWLSEGLDRIVRVHAALADRVLHRQQPGNALVDAAAWTERLLDDALCLADAHASLRAATSDLKQHVAEARTAIRRSDSARLSSALRSHRRGEKDLSRLAAAIKKVTRRASPHQMSLESMREIEVAGTVREVIVATASASAAIIDGMATMSSAASAAAASAMKDSFTTWSIKRLTSKRKKGRMEEEAVEMVAMEKLEGLEECLERLDHGNQKVFRCLVSTRVFLLNILTPSL